MQTKIKEIEANQRLEEGLAARSLPASPELSGGGAGKNYQDVLEDMAAPHDNKPLIKEAGN
ncbi:MAG: hypothetical protein ACREU8_06620 [Gammaproteobacteria bacterium]